MIKIQFPDGNVKEFEAGVTGLDIAKSISPKLAKEVLAVSVNDAPYCKGCGNQVVHMG